MLEYNNNLQLHSYNLIIILVKKRRTMRSKMPTSINNRNNKHFFNLQVANSPSRLRFEANLSRESS